MSFLRPAKLSAEGADVRPGDVQPGSAGEAELPLIGYEGLDDHDIIGVLSKHSQVELDAIEAFERSHEARPVVLQKLHYLRGAEPFPGYDELGVEAILAALGDADKATLRRMRVYERKFQNRPQVLDPIADVLRERRPAAVHRV